MIERHRAGRLLADEKVSRVMAFAELQELVDTPNETLGVEYKSWLDLNSHEARADIARHIAAIANHGGGYIVFGFDDTTLQYVPSPYADKIDRDVISSIVKKYLEPTLNVMFHSSGPALGMNTLL